MAPLHSVLAGPAEELLTECTLSKESAAEHPELIATCSQSAPASNGRKVKSSCDAVDGGGKDYLTESEIAQFLAASKLGRHGVRGLLHDAACLFVTDCALVS